MNDITTILKRKTFQIAMAGAFISLAAAGCSFPGPPREVRDPVVIESEKRTAYVRGSAGEVRAAVLEHFKACGFEPSADAPSRLIGTAWRLAGAAGPRLYDALTVRIGNAGASFVGIEVTAFRAGSVDELARPEDVREAERILAHAEQEFDERPGVISHALVEAFWRNERKKKELHEELDQDAEEAEDNFDSARRNLERARRFSALRQLSIAPLPAADSDLLGALGREFGFTRPR